MRWGSRGWGLVLGGWNGGPVGFWLQLYSAHFFLYTRPIPSASLNNMQMNATIKGNVDKARTLAQAQTRRPLGSNTTLLRRNNGSPSRTRFADEDADGPRQLERAQEPIGAM